MNETTTLTKKPTAQSELKKLYKGWGTLLSIKGKIHQVHYSKAELISMSDIVTRYQQATPPVSLSGRS